MHTTRAERERHWVRKEGTRRRKECGKERDMIMQYHQAKDCRQHQEREREWNLNLLPEKMPKLMSIPIRTNEIWNFLFTKFSAITRVEYIAAAAAVKKEKNKEQN